MTDEELKQLVASLAISNQQLTEEQRLTSLSIRELSASQKDTDLQFKETVKENRQRQKEIDKQLKELGKQIGGLGEKFGSFTEGLALPSMRKVLEKVFGIEAAAPRYRIRKNGKTLELDVFGYRNGNDPKAVIVEVKSHLREEHIEQMLSILNTAREFLPEHAAKQFYGILAVVDAPEILRERTLQQGIYYAEIHDNIFTLQVPAEFQARAF